MNSDIREKKRSINPNIGETILKSESRVVDYKQVGEFKLPIKKEFYSINWNKVSKGEQFRNRFLGGIIRTLTFGKYSGMSNDFLNKLVNSLMWEMLAGKKTESIGYVGAKGMPYLPVAGLETRDAYKKALLAQLKEGSKSFKDRVVSDLSAGDVKKMLDISKQEMPKHLKQVNFQRNAQLLRERLGFFNERYEGNTLPEKTFESLVDAFLKDGDIKEAFGEYEYAVEEMDQKIGDYIYRAQQKFTDKDNSDVGYFAGEIITEQEMLLKFDERDLAIYRAIMEEHPKEKLIIRDKRKPIEYSPFLKQKLAELESNVKKAMDKTPLEISYPGRGYGVPEEKEPMNLAQWKEAVLARLKSPSEKAMFEKEYAKRSKQFERLGETLFTGMSKEAFISIFESGKVTPGWFYGEYKDQFAKAFEGIKKDIDALEELFLNQANLLPEIRNKELAEFAADAKVILIKKSALQRVQTTLLSQAIESLRAEFIRTGDKNLLTPESLKKQLTLESKPFLEAERKQVATKVEQQKISLENEQKLKDRFAATGITDAHDTKRFNYMLEQFNERQNNAINSNALKPLTNKQVDAFIAKFLLEKVGTFEEVLDGSETKDSLLASWSSTLWGKSGWFAEYLGEKDNKLQHHAALYDKLFPADLMLDMAAIDTPFKKNEIALVDVLTKFNNYYGFNLDSKGVYGLLTEVYDYYESVSEGNFEKNIFSQNALFTTARQYLMTTEKYKKIVEDDIVFFKDLRNSGDKAALAFWQGWTRANNLSPVVKNEGERRSIWNELQNRIDNVLKATPAKEEVKGHYLSAAESVPDERKVPVSFEVRAARAAHAALKDYEMPMFDEVMDERLNMFRRMLWDKDKMLENANFSNDMMFKTFLDKPHGQEYDSGTGEIRMKLDEIERSHRPEEARRLRRFIVSEAMFNHIRIKVFKGEKVDESDFKEACKVEAKRIFAENPDTNKLLAEVKLVSGNVEKLEQRLNEVKNFIEKQQRQIEEKHGLVTDEQMKIGEKLEDALRGLKFIPGVRGLLNKKLTDKDLDAFFLQFINDVSFSILKAPKVENKQSVKQDYGRKDLLDMSAKALGVKDINAALKQYGDVFGADAANLFKAERDVLRERLLLNAEAIKSYPKRVADYYYQEAYDKAEAEGKELFELPWAPRREDFFGVVDAKNFDVFIDNIMKEKGKPYTVDGLLFYANSLYNYREKLFAHGNNPTDEQLGKYYIALGELVANATFNKNYQLFRSCNNLSVKVKRRLAKREKTLTLTSLCLRTKIYSTKC